MRTSRRLAITVAMLEVDDTEQFTFALFGPCTTA